jgi:hypothetical protein
MAAVITVGTAIVVAVVAASAGYYFRRREHLRERRLDAYQAVFAAFLDAARSAADLLSVHTQVGWPRELSAETWTEEQREEMTSVHRKAWERAAGDRRAFEVAVYGVELVASEDARVDIEALRAFLEGAAYSGSPWKHGDNAGQLYPSAGLNPVDIEPKAIETVRPFVRRAARELWGRDAAAAPHRIRPGIAMMGLPPVAR